MPMPCRRKIFSLPGALLAVSVVWSVYCLFCKEGPLDLSTFARRNKRSFPNSLAEASRGPIPKEEGAKNDNRTSSRLADGCYHVFIDAGANIGVHGRFLYEPGKYPNAELARFIFDQEFGPPNKRDNRDFCVFEIEPNPSHHERIQNNSAAYLRMGWRYTLLPYGISDEQSKISFYKQNDVAKNEWGFTAIGGHGKDGRKANEVIIPVIRLSTWLEQNVWNRNLPDRVFGNYADVVDGYGHNGGPKVVMKMDIEGMEYRVLPDLLISGMLCKVLDLVFGEIHYFDRFFPFHFNNKVVIENKKQGRAFLSSMSQVIRGSPNCKTRIVEADDEAYLKDGMALPAPPDAAKNGQ